MSDAERKKTNGRKLGKCPICRKTLEPDTPTAPFCSDRCKQIDLGRWLGEDYRVSRPIEEADLDEGE